MVWIVDEKVKRAHYKMGTVLEVYHGCDERVRSALVKTEEGKLKRPVVKLAPMFYESIFMKLGTHTQVHNTNTPTKCQGHSPILTPFTPHMCDIQGLYANNVYIAIYSNDHFRM